MRIHSGAFRGRSIKTVEGPGYRPATAKVREAAFNMLSARGLEFEGLRVADFFAGSGSLGIEALSRGAEFALFVEMNRKAAAMLRENLRGLGVEPARYRVEARDLFTVLKARPDEAFGLIFIDPPYGQNLLEPALQLAFSKAWVAPGALILAEVEASLDFKDLESLPGLALETDRCYGQTRILLWRTTDPA
ncbi:16S rRNA (guanine(966)-N(2))-methyltransferase RsmD [Desulfocurvibacter africanus]|uniref:Methyltransferase n=1 Tax=Desulfocurvibacter africanus subsp. africanus str. Walvis Bay TaxID=690850 RepID=F3Z398_DESAF|nr:16S rRNA (guanine(966)-N(2))-methyltransferase RsmD [Desulfocurvibacter africanus]EGJ51438.1 methyltransferase [Desulfocurvibacter africanus subsp. africanus str. Walvis Bay]